MSFVVGLTGGIGSGKSFVAEAFASRGIDVTDADRIAHSLTAPGQPGLAAIVDAFGPSFCTADGALDRSRLRRHVFEDAAERARLEALLHPMIRETALREIAAWRSPYGLFVVPLLFERGRNPGVDRTLVVDCPEEEQVRRVVATRGLTAAEVRAIMSTQLPRAERLARADDVLDNSGPPSAVPPRVAELDLRYRTLAAATSTNGGA